MNESASNVNVAPMPNIGHRIKRLRESVAGRTQAEFARLLGVSRGAVGNWEVGKGVKRENLQLISRKTGVSIEWLMNGSDDGAIPFTSKPTPLEVAANEGLNHADAEDALAWSFQELEGGSEAEARVLARAVLKVIRSPATHSGAPMSAQDRRSLIETAIRLFRAK